MDTIKSIIELRLFAIEVAIQSCIFAGPQLVLPKVKQIEEGIKGNAVMPNTSDTSPKSKVEVRQEIYKQLTVLSVQNSISISTYNASILENYILDGITLPEFVEQEAVTSKHNK